MRSRDFHVTRGSGGSRKWGCRSNPFYLFSITLMYLYKCIVLFGILELLRVSKFKVSIYNVRNINNLTAKQSSLAIYGLILQESYSIEVRCTVSVLHDMIEIRCRRTAFLTIV